MAMTEVDPAAVRKLARGTRHRRWLREMLSEKGMRMATYFNSDGSIDRNEWESIRRFWVKLGRAGYLIEESPSEFDSWVKVKVHLVGFDPVVGQLICGVATCMRNDGWSRASWGFIRQQARLLREAFPTDREAEVAIGLLPSWSPQDAVAGFPDLLMVVTGVLTGASAKSSTT